MLLNSQVEVVELAVGYMVWIQRSGLAWRRKSGSPQHKVACEAVKPTETTQEVKGVGKEGSKA